MQPEELMAKINAMEGVELLKNPDMIGCDIAALGSPQCTGVIKKFASQIEADLVAPQHEAPAMDSSLKIPEIGV